MHKLGMRLEQETVDPTCGCPVRVHAITKAQYTGASQGRRFPPYGKPPRAADGSI